MTRHDTRICTPQVAEDAGIKLMTAFQRRFDPSFARLHKVRAVPIVLPLCVCVYKKMKQPLNKSTNDQPTNMNGWNQAIADGVVGDPISAILQSRDPSPPPFSYVKGGGGLFKVRNAEAFRLSLSHLLCSFVGHRQGARSFP